MFDCEVVIAEKENVESVVGLASEHAGGLLVKIMYNAVTINQNLVSHFTSDKKVNVFIFCLELFALIIFIFISLTMNITSAVIDQSAAVTYSCKLSVFVSYFSGRITVARQVRDYDCILFHLYFWAPMHIGLSSYQVMFV